MLDADSVAELAACVAPGGALTAPGEIAPFITPARRLPALVLLPSTAAEAGAVLRVANRRGVRVAPRGAGSSDPDATPEGAVLLASGRLNRILDVDAANLTAAVEPGVSLGEFQASMEALGLFLPPDPLNLEAATLGGATALNSSGPRALKYGSVKDYVLGLDAVLADGSALHTGANTVKNASGYNLTHLFVGSRGTLCFYTRILVRLLPLPAARRTLVFSFAGLEVAARLAAPLLAAKVLPARLELLDRVAADRLEAACPIRLPRHDGALLLCELDGSVAGVSRQAEVATDLATAAGAGEVAVLPAEDSDTLWMRLRGLRADLDRGRASLGEVTAPPDILPALLGAIEALCRQHEAPVGLVVYPGTGHIGFALAEEQSDSAATARLISFWQAARETLDRHWVVRPRQPDTVAGELVRGLKAAYDPHGILNPGSRFPSGREDLWQVATRSGAGTGVD